MNRIHSTIIAVLLALVGLCGTLQAAPPTVQARNLTFSDKGSTSVKLTFLSPSGSGARSLIVVSTDNTIGAPSNGTTYTVVDNGDYSSDANPTISGDKVVGNMASPSAVNYNITVTGLQPNTTYYFKVYEFNTSNGNEYLTSNSTNNPRSFTTLPTAPIVLNPDNLTTTSADLRWYDVSGATNYLLDVIKAADANDDNVPDDAGTVIYDQEDVGDPTNNLNIYNIGGLSNTGTDGYYFYRVYSSNNNGTSEYSSWVRFDVLEDNTPPTFAIEYFSNSAMTTSLGNNPVLKTGTYYIKITASEPLQGVPTISINGEGANNDVVNANTVRMDNDSIFRYSRTIVSEAAINGSTISDFSITGTDAAGNTSTNVNPTNEATRADYIDVTASSASSISLFEAKPINACGSWAWNAGSTGLDVTFSIPDDASLVGGALAIQGVSSLSSTTYRTVHSTAITNGMINGNSTITVPASAIEAMTDFADNATVDYRVVLTDKAGNIAYGAVFGSPLDIDQTAPTLTAVSIESNNTHNANIAKTGDVITLRFTSSDLHSLNGFSSGTIAGVAFDAMSISNPSNGVYLVTFTVPADATEGPVAFSINPVDGACNAGAAVTATTNGSSVIIDNTAPVAAAPTAVTTTGGEYQNAGYWNAGNTFVNVTVPLDASDATLDGGTIQLWADANQAGDGNEVGFTHTIATSERAAGSVTLQIPDVDFEAITDFAEGDEVEFSYVIMDRAGNTATSDVSPSTLIVDRIPVAGYEVEYYSNSTMTNSLGANPVIGPGTYYVKITSSEPLFDNPQFMIDAPCGTTYDVTNLTASEAVSSTTYRFTRTIPANATCELNGIAGSSETIYVRGTDAAGNVNSTPLVAAPSATMNAAAKIDTRDPEISSAIALGVTPTDADQVTFDVTFDEPVNFQTANVSLTGTLSGAAYVSNVASLGGNAYRVTVTMNDPSENGTVGIKVENTVKDDHNNNFRGGELASSALYTIDNGYPTIASVNSGNISIGANIEVTFSENIRLTGGAGKVYLDDVYGGVDNREGADFVLTVSGNKLIINPISDLNNNKTYGLRIEADVVEDLSGNDFAGLADNSTFRFTTPDTEIPTADLFSPVDDATSIDRDADLSITFSENVRFTSNGTVTLYNTDNSNIIAQYSVSAPGSNLSISGRTLTINPSADLPNFTNVAVQISNGAIEDLYGNDFGGILNNTIFNFRTVDNVAPTFTSIIPGNNDTGVLRNSDLTITLSENVQVGNNANARFSIRRVANGTYFASYRATDPQVSIAGNTITVDPSSALEDMTQYYVEIGSGFVEDVNGDENQFAGFSGATTWTFTTRDESAPTLTSTVPTHAAIDVALNQNIVLNFSEPVYRGTGNFVLRLDGGADVETFNAATTTKIAGWGTNQLTIDPTSNLLGPNGGNLYEVIIPNSAVKDASNNAYAGLADNAYQFRSVDATAPTVTINSPADGATNVQDDANLVFTFNEAVTKGTGFIEIKRSSNNSVFEAIDVTSAKVTMAGNTITINPAGTFESTTGYYVNIPATAFKDSYNNFYAGISNSTSWNFTAEDLTAPTVSSRVPANNATGVAQNANFVITFNENVALNTVADNNGLIEVRQSSNDALKESFSYDGAAWTGSNGGTVTVAGQSVTINPLTDLTNNTQYYILVKGQAISDLNSNFWAGYSLPSNWTFRAVDNVAPAVVTLTPLNTATDVNETVNLSVVFDEEIRKGTGNITVTKANAPNAGDATYAIDNSWVTITGGNTLVIDLPANLLSSGNYYITIAAGAVEDLSGNDAAQIGGDNVWEFNVRDYQGPQITSLTPAQNATTASMTTDLTLVFDESVVRGTGSIKVYKASDNTVRETISVTDVERVAIVGNTVSVNLDSALLEKTNYYVTISATAFRDAKDNNFAGFVNPTDWTFRTLDQTAPLASFTPTDGATGVNVTDNFYITFNEPVVKGSGNITIQGGAQTLTIDVTGSQVTLASDGLSATINPTDDLSNFQTDYTISTDAAGVFEDLAGNDLAQITNTMWNFRTQDIAAPVLSSTNPANNATGTSRSADLVATFSENVKRGSTGTVQIRKYSDNSLFESFDYSSAALTFATNTLTINPTNNLSENTRYYVTITNGTVLDMSNNEFAGINSPATWNFTTGDATAPLATDFAPNDDAVNVALDNNLVVTFNEDVKNGTSVSIEIRRTSGDVLVETITSLTNTSNPANGAAGYSGNKLYINPTNSLLANTAYNVRISGTSVRDLSNNNFAGITNATSWNFTTLDNQAPTISSLSPANGATGVAPDANFVITYSENVKQGYGTIKLWHDLGTDEEIESIQLPTNDSRITVSGNTVTINWNATLESENQYYVEVINAAGQSAIEDLNGNDAPAISSGAWAITVDDVIAPLMTASTPADEDVDVQDNANIVLTFDDNVAKGSATGVITLRNCSDNSIVEEFTFADFVNGVPANGQAGFSGNQVTINPTSTFTGSTCIFVTVNATAVKDDSDNFFAGFDDATTLNFTTEDLTAPVISSLTPSDNSTSASRTANMQIAFNENVKKGTGYITIRSALTDAIFDQIDVTSGDVTITNNVASINFDPDFLANASYYVAVDAGTFMDMNDNIFTGGWNDKTTWNFRTIDDIAPTLVAAIPADNSTNVANNANLLITFNEPVKAGTGNIVIVQGTDLYENIDITNTDRVQFSGNQITINPSNDFASSQPYIVLIASGVIKDIANNNFAGITDSTAWNFTSADNTIPMITGVTPANNATEVLVNSNVTLTFSENVTANAGNIYIRRVSNGSTWRTIDVTAAEVSIAGNVVTINPAVDFESSTAYYVDVEANAFKDASANGNAEFSGLTGLRFTTQDIIAPYVLSLDPTDNTTGVKRNGNITLTFSENVKPGTTGTIEVKRTSDDMVAFSVDMAADTVINETGMPTADGIAAFVTNGGTTVRVALDSANLADNTEYYVTITGDAITDMSGNFFQGINSKTLWSFTTGDATDPTVTAYSPADNAAGVAPNSNLTLTFTENVKRGTAGNVVIYNEDGTAFETIPYSDMTRLTFSGTTLTINPDVDLSSSANYYVHVGNHVVTDMNNNYYAGIANATTWNFATSDVIAPVIVSTSPSDNSSNNALNSNLYITFSETIAKGAGNITVMRHNEGDDDTVVETIDVASANVTIANNVAIIDPTSDLPNAFIYVLVDNGAFKDLTDNNFIGISDSTVWNFAVGDVIAPTIVSVIPANEATEVALDADLTVVFSENVQKGLNTGKISIYRSSDNQLVEEIAADSDQITVANSTITIEPTNLLNYNTSYYVTISNEAVRDLAGNFFAGLTGIGTWSFTTVVGDTVRPTLVSFTPADGAINVNENDDLVLTFSEPVSAVAGKNIVIHNADGSVFETIDASTATFDGSEITIPVSMLASSGSYYVNMEAGAFEDTLGNASYAITGSAMWNFDVRDFVAPTVSTYSPADNATNVLVGSNLVLTFSENVKKGASGNIVIINSDDETLATIPVTDSRVTISGATVTINPDTLNYGEVYHVFVDNTAILDMNDNAFAGISDATTWNFTMEQGDFVAPTVLAMTPADNSTDVDMTSDLTIRFSEKVTPVAGKFIKVYRSGVATLFASVEATNAVKVSDSIYTITLPDLESATGYYVQIDAGSFKDGFNNEYAGIANESDWNFTSEDYVAPTVSSFNPADNATEVLTDANFLVNFSEPVYAGSGNIVIYRGDGQVFESIPVTDARVSISNAEVTINPTAELANNTNYYINVPATALRDASNNFYAGISDATTWNFKSEVGDVTAPVLTAKTPVDGSNTAMIDGNLTMTFDENIAEGTGNVVIYRASDDQEIESIDVTGTNVTVSGNTITINPSVTLSNATAYYVQVANGAIEDVYGNAWTGINDKTTWNFTTLPELATEPAAITNLSKVKSDANQLTFRWKPNHASKKVIVIGRKGTAGSQYNINIDTTLLDGHDYNFNTTQFGQSPADSIARTDNVNSTHWVAYKGTDTVITVGGLTGLTGYTFAVYAYDENSGDPLTRNYNESRVQIKMKTSKEGVEETEVSYGNDLFEVSEIAPNPVQNVMNFTVSSASELSYDIELYTSTGELVMKPYSNYAPGAGSHNVSIPLVTKGQIAAGSYLLRVTAGGMVITQNVVVIP